MTFDENGKKFIDGIADAVEYAYARAGVQATAKDIASESVRIYFDFMSNYAANANRPPKVEIKWPVSL